MARIDWSTYDRLRAEGRSGRQIATTLAVPESTLRAALKRRPDGPPAAQVTPATPVPPAVPAPPAITMVAVQEIQEILTIVRDLQARVQTLEQAPAAPAPPVLHAPPAMPAAPAGHAPPAVERRDVQQWTVRLSAQLIADLKQLAYQERLNPSELTERLLRQALHEKGGQGG